LFKSSKSLLIYQWRKAQGAGRKEKIHLTTDIVDWLSGCKKGFIPHLQDNWTLQLSKIITF
jgi:hypothetical protein